jgi:hypothetical protein
MSICQYNIFAQKVIIWEQFGDILGFGGNFSIWGQFGDLATTMRHAMCLEANRNLFKNTKLRLEGTFFSC